MVYKKTNKRTHNLNEAIKKISLTFHFYFPPMTEQNCKTFLMSDFLTADFSVLILS